MGMIVDLQLRGNLLTKSDVARIFGCSRQYVSVLSKRDDWPRPVAHHRLRGHDQPLYRPDDVLAWRRVSAGQGHISRSS